MGRATTIGGRAEARDPRLGISELSAQLVRRYARLIRSAVGRVGGAAASRIGDDVEQQVQIQLFRQLAAEQEIRSPASYLYRAAVRETVRVLRGEARAERGLAEATRLPRTGDPGPERAVELRELRAQVAGALGTLTPERRLATKAHLAGFEVGEVMAMYGWTYHRARNLIARGMADLRRALRARGIHG